MIIGITNRHNPFRMVLMFLLFVAGMNMGHAQQTLSGKVVGKVDKAPVAGAFVYAYGGKTLTAYAMSDKNGLFVLTIQKGKSADRLVVTCLGYNSETVILEGNKESYTVAMTENHISIKASKVKASVVEEKGDTVSYSAGAFSDGTERALGELLEKLPGISVTQSGGILYNGSHINKFYIEGLDLMGAGYGVITKNLSPDKIAKVEVYKRHQPIRALVGVQQTDKSAINIVLKEDARSTWMITGNFIGGAPEFPLFDAKALLSRFSKKSQDLYLLKGNNIGGDIIKELTQQQYLGKTGAFLISEESLDSDFISRLNPRRSSLPISQDYWYDNLSGIASFNHLSKIKDDSQLRVSLQGAAERYGESVLTSEQISFNDSEQMLIEERDEMTDVKYYVSGKMGYEKNSAKQYIRNDLVFSGQIRSNHGFGTGSANDYTQNYDLPSFKAENILDATFRTADKRAIALSSATKFVSNNHSADFSTENMSAHQILSDRSVVSDNEVSTILRIKDLRMKLGLGLDLEYIGLDSRLTGMDRMDLISEASSDLFSIAPSLSMSTSFLIGKTEAHVHVPFKLKMVSGGLVERIIAFPELMPSVSFQRRLSRNLNANARLSYSLSRSDLESLFPAAVMSSYRRVSYSDSLSRRQSGRALIGLNWEDNIHMIYAGITGSASFSISDRSTSNFYSDEFTVNTYTDARGRMGIYGVSGNISKFFGARTFVVQLTGGWDRTDQSLYLQNIARSYISDQWNVALSLRTNPADWISIEAKADYMDMSVKGDNTSDSKQLKVSGMIAVKPFKPMSIDTYADYLWESVPGTRISNIPLLRSSLSWKFKRFSLVFECRNILGCKEFRREHVYAFQTVSSTTRLRGRQFLAGIRMSL